MITILLMLALAAGVSSKAARMLAHTTPEPPHGAVAQPAHAARSDAPPGPGAVPERGASPEAAAVAAGDPASADPTARSTAATATDTATPRPAASAEAQASLAAAEAFGPVAPAAGLAAPPLVPAASPDSDADTDARPAHGFAEEPAIARAAEAGLQRMRVQFSGLSIQPAHPGPEGADGLAEAAAAMGLAPGRSPAPGRAAVPPDGSTPGARLPPPEAFRDGRDPRSTRDGAAAPRPPGDPAPLRRLTLPIGDRVLRAVPAEGSVTLVGQATVLIRSHGLTVLTDPNFLRRGEPARLGLGLAATRRTDPAIDLDELPPIDVVVLSRLREDHFDRLVRRRLPRDVPIVAPPQARAALAALGFSSVHPLPAWGSLRIGRGDDWVQVTATPARDGPVLIGALQPAPMGALLEFGRGEVADYRIWFGGGTRIDDALVDELRPRLGTVDLALLPLGAPSPLAAIGAGLDAASGLRAAARLAPAAAIPLRLDDFDTRPMPVQALAAAARASAGSATRIRLLERGDAHRFAPLQVWAFANRDDASSRP